MDQISQEVRYKPDCPHLSVDFTVSVDTINSRAIREYLRTMYPNIRSEEEEEDSGCGNAEAVRHGDSTSTVCIDP